MTAFFHVRPSRRFIISAFVFTVSVWIFYLTIASKYNNREVFVITEDEGNHNVTLLDEAEPMRDIKILALRELVSERNSNAIKRLKDLSETKVFRYVFVVQVHDRKTYIRAMLESLASLRNIQDALVIFSHDVVEEVIDSLPFTVSKSFETVQIYFPHSLQLHPDRFPGVSPHDCPERVSKAEATKKRCLFHDHPDSYGNYRTPRLTQVKHHWWWKFQFVFTHVPSAQANVPVLFVEEDHYFLPDALYVLDELVTKRESACSPRCAVLSVAHHKTKLASEPEAYSRYFIGQWVGSRDNIGIVFDYDLYKLIHSCAKTFCHIDDYNWDWSLFFVITKCLKKEYHMIMPLAPRVLHIGDCGGIHHKAACDPAANVKSAVETVANAKGKLFPEKLTKTSQALMKPRDPKVNGGWGDPRDHELCDRVSNQTDVPVSYSTTKSLTMPRERGTLLRVSN